MEIIKDTNFLDGHFVVIITKTTIYASFRKWIDDDLVMFAKSFTTSDKNDLFLIKVEFLKEYLTYIRKRVGKSMCINSPLDGFIHHLSVLLHNMYNQKHIICARLPNSA